MKSVIPSIEELPSLQTLLDDFKWYQLDVSNDPGNLHAGDLYHHSLWTYYAMVDLLESNFLHQENIYFTARQKEIVLFAALIHDIGKAGRKELFNKTHPEFYYDIKKKPDGTLAGVIYRTDRQEHSTISFDYARSPFLAKDQQRIYYRIDPATLVLIPFNMHALYQETGLTYEEQQIVAVLLGMHYEFGNLEMGKITIEHFFELLQELMQKANINFLPDIILVSMCILINCADVTGLLLVKAHSTSLFPLPLVFTSMRKPYCFVNTTQQKSLYSELIAYYKKMIIR